MATTKKRPATTGKAKASAAGRAQPKPGSAKYASIEASPAVQAQVVIILILSVLFLLFAVSRYTT